MSRLGLLASAIGRMAFHGLIAPVAAPRKARLYWESLVWAAANAPLSRKTGDLPEADPEEVVPEIQNVSCDLRDYLPVYGNIVPLEMMILCRIVKALAPRRVFEFGTFNGGTTLQIGVNSPPDARILTLDLPYDSPLRQNIDIVDVRSDLIGGCFTNSPWAAKIERLYGDSMTFAFEPYKNSMDLIFVDASHNEKYVASDTQSALSMLAPGGVILWHDYAEHAPGVVRVLDRLGARLPLRHVRMTSLAIYRSPAAEPTRDS